SLPCSFCLSLNPPPPNPTLFPYTTLFRSRASWHPRTSGTAPWWSTPWLQLGSPHRARASRAAGPRTPRARSRHARCSADFGPSRSEEHTSELQSRENLVCRLLLEKKKKKQ